MQRWAAGAPSPDVAIPAEPIRCLGRVLWGKQKRGLDSVWVRVDEVQSVQNLSTSLSLDARDGRDAISYVASRLGYLRPTVVVTLTPQIERPYLQKPLSRTLILPML